MGAARVEGVIEQGSSWLGCCGWMVSPTVSVRVRRRLMGSLVDELRRREAAAREEAEELRGRIAQLAERLAGVEERLSRLVITRAKVEGLRSKLKRLAERGWLAEDAGPGLFTLPSRAGAGEAAKPG